MISKKMEEALNTQINKEMYSGLLYMAMSAQCKEMGLDGFAKWFMVQFHEEMFHAMKIYEYIQRPGRNCKVTAHRSTPGSLQIRKRNGGENPGT